MSGFLTLQDLRNVKQSLTLQESTRLVENAGRRSPRGSTFLSHSSQDAEFLPAVIRILEAHGAIVYIDKKDASLPPYTSQETALMLRGRIAQCRRFVLFATATSKDSRWMPWELGIADGLKHRRGVAIMPAVETVYETAWTKREYLGVYDRVAWGRLEGYQEELWMVLDQENNTARTLANWLRE